jgi:hypothetical protein
MWMATRLLVVSVALVVRAVMALLARRHPDREEEVAPAE